LSIISQASPLGFFVSAERFMPVTQITLLPGYGEDIRARLVDRVSAAVRSVIASAEAGTTTYVQEAATYRRDGRVFSGGGAARPVASDVVRAFLQAMQSRDLTLARSFLAPSFSMCFPGGACFTSLEDLVAWGAGRYRGVGKHFDRFDECWAEEGTVVYCHGSLFGQWPDGRAFEGIRFIDRFLVVDGLLARQDVWNDLAEHKGLAP
jgi:hypothetical protein